jgi:hypothetical protein
MDNNKFYLPFKKEEIQNIRDRVNQKTKYFGGFKSETLNAMTTKELAFITWSKVTILALLDYIEALDNKDAILTNETKCPFCGGKARTIARETHIPTRKIKTESVLPLEELTVAMPRVNDGWLVECEDCGARGPHDYTNPIQSMQEAVIKWNKRAEGI